MSPIVDADADERPRAGRPRSEEADRAILAAAIDVLLEDGYAGLSMEGVASRAGVGKATVYRRWATKVDLVIEAVKGTAVSCLEAPERGHVHDDMVELLEQVVATMRGVDGRLMAAFTAERLRHPDLATAFSHQFVAPRRAVLVAVIRRGVERGQLPAGSDVELLADVGPAVIWNRLTMHEAPWDDDLARHIADQFFPLAPAPK